MNRVRLSLRSFVTGGAILTASIGLSACNEVTRVPGGVLGIGQTPTSPTDEPKTAPTDATALYTGPAELAKYVGKFVDDAKAQGVDVTPEMSNPKLEIRIASLSSYGSSVIGLCETSGSLRRVTFSPTFWDSVDETQRELLAHHELGHCVLYRPHRTEILSDGSYASLMYPFIMRSSTYTANYDYYQNELFHYSAAEVMPENYDPNMVTVHVCDNKELGMEVQSEQ
ncbi:MAG: hypothetical protein KGQ59_05850 [Bdellovibrionales bacterium]|nr:hypothetical protein [Bdellovibrionales bacterium]